MLAGCNTWAQDAFRASLAGQAAAEARKRAFENQRFNVKLGPVKLRVSAQLGVEATDNVRYTDSQDAEPDLIFRPQLNLATLWRVTEKNSLNLLLGIGYDKYVRTPKYDNLFISPDTDLSFDLYVSDFRINLHSRFSYSQDLAGDPTVSGIGRLSRFENTSGVDVTWDLNEVILAVRYDHLVYLPTEDDYSQYTRASDLGSVSAAFQIQPTFFAGLQLGGGLTSYDEQTQWNNTQFSVGPFILLQVNEYIHLRLAGGYVLFFFDEAAQTNASTQLDAFYLDVTLRQRLGNSLSHSLSAGRQLQSSVYSTPTDEYYARYGLSWHLFKKTSLGISISYQNISYPQATSSGNQRETVDYYGLGLTLARPIARRTTASLGYQFYFRDSDDESGEYVQNRLVLNVVHAF